MRAFTSLVAFAAGLAVAQQTSEFPDETGVRSLWIPFKTIDGTPVASIAGNKSDVTVYIVSCPTASPGCAIAPNLTLTEGPSTVVYTSTASDSGMAILGCTLDGTTSATCSNVGRGGGNIAKDTSTIGADQIKYQAISITQTINNTATLPVTITQTVTPTTSMMTTSSPGGANPTAGAPWAMGGAFGAGILALAAL